MEPLQNARYELKMVVPEVLLPFVRAQLYLHPAGIRKTYPPRVVSNVYFDDNEFSRFRESVEGISERRKVRLRWYGEGSSATRLALEIKRKRAQLGWKIVHPVSVSIDFAYSVRWSEIVSSIRGSVSLDGRREIALTPNPVLANR